MSYILLVSLHMYMIFKCSRVLSIDLYSALATYVKLGVKVYTDCALHHCSCYGTHRHRVHNLSGKLLKSK